MSGNGSRRPSLVFALQGGPAEYRRACAERLAEATRSLAVDADAWLRIFALHAESERAVPQIAWEVERAVTSLAWLGYQIDGDRVSIGGVDVSEAFRSQQCADLAEEWRNVPYVSDLAINWARAEIERVIEPNGKVVAYGENVADAVAPKSQYRIYFDDQEQEREREAVLPFAEIASIPDDLTTDATPKVSIGAIIRDSKEAPPSQAEVEMPDPATVSPSAALTIHPERQSPTHAADWIADVYEADRYIAMAALREQKLAQSIEKHIEHENRKARDEERKFEAAERRAS